MVEMHFLFLHGTGGGPNECWYPWLADILQRKKYSVLAPRFPSPDNQTLENWLTTMQPYWKVFDPELVLIGRSIGATFALRLLEKSPVKIKAAFLVAGFCSDIGRPEFDPVVDTFLAEPFNWQKIRANCSRFFVYHGDNDPIVEQEYGEELAQKVGAELKVIENGEHLWFETFPEILTDIEALEKK